MRPERPKPADRAGRGSPWVHLGPPWPRSHRIASHASRIACIPPLTPARPSTVSPPPPQLCTCSSHLDLPAWASRHRKVCTVQESATVCSQQGRWLGPQRLKARCHVGFRFPLATLHLLLRTFHPGRCNGCRVQSVSQPAFAASPMIHPSESLAGEVLPGRLFWFTCMKHSASPARPRGMSHPKATGLPNRTPSPLSGVANSAQRAGSRSNTRSHSSPHARGLPNVGCF